MNLCNNCNEKEATHKKKTLCLNCYIKEWRKNNPEKAKIISKKYRLKNKNKCKERLKKWREKNPEKYKQQQDKHNNTDKHRKTSRECYRKKHPNIKKRVL